MAKCFEIASKSIFKHFTMKTFNIKIVHNLLYQKIDNSFPIYLRILNSRKYKDISINVATLPECFDKDKTRIKKNDVNHEKKNFMIQKAINRANNIIFDFEKNDKQLTLSEFKRLFLNEIETKCFYSFVSSELIHYKGNTLKSHKSDLKKLKTYRKELNFNDIDLSFIKNYFSHLTKHGNEPSTAGKALKFIKTFLNRAIQEGIIEKNVFDNYPLKKYEGNRKFLTLLELQSLQSMFDANILPYGQQNVLKYFLFCCYTGIRHVDIKNLRFRNIQNVNHEDVNYKIVDFIQEKTGVAVRIPLSDHAKVLISKGLPYEKVFRVISTTNRKLKEIIKKAGINKEISFHCSRHTFAVNSLNLGMSIDLISKLLGHSDLQTTMLYLKYEDKFKIEEMGKWNDKKKNVR